MHIIFFNTKGGVCKSTLCDYSANELMRLGYSVEVTNTDQQNHVEAINTPDADFSLYDTAGVYLGETIKLLELAREAAENGQPVRVVVPMTLGHNDQIELPFLLEKLQEIGILDLCVFVFTKVRKNSKTLRERKGHLSGLGLNVSKFSLPYSEDFINRRFTTKTRNEISNFLHEVFL
ncbi:TPA: ParA family protein [Vibrio harveyi]|nr:ParA family protein [Vibrio harveyi]